jgi:hypothetical protein
MRGRSIAGQVWLMVLLGCGRTAVATTYSFAPFNVPGVYDP